MVDRLLVWNGVQSLAPKKFTCWKCGHLVATDKGWGITSTPGGFQTAIIAHL